MKDLAGRLAFITAAASGIGLGMARAFAADGMSLVLTDIDETALDQAGAELRETTKVETYVLDVSDRESYLRVAADAESKLGPVSVLCNNAASHVEVPLAYMSFQAWDHMIGVTLGGQINGVQIFLPEMLARNEPAHLVNTASQAGIAVSHGGRKYMYNTAKFGVVGMSEALHQALADTPIGVTLLCPGYTATNGAQQGLIALRAQKLPAEIEEPLVQRILEMEKQMKGHGRSPNDVGRDVVSAIKRDVFYVHTQRRVNEVAGRAQAIIDAMPAETDADRALADHVRS